MANLCFGQELYTTCPRLDNALEELGTGVSCARTNDWV